MTLIYNLEFKENSLAVKLEEKGNSRRILYLDTLKALARDVDKEALPLLIKIHLRSPNASRSSDTLSFGQIVVEGSQAGEVLRALLKTGKLFCGGKPISPGESAKVYWKGEKHSEKACTVSGALHCKSGKIIPLEECGKLYPGWYLKEDILGEIDSALPWKWVELFGKGAALLEGVQKKKFLEENPPVVWKEIPAEKPLEIFPVLQLKDATGSFADLWMEYRGAGKVAFEDLAPSLKGKLRQKEIEASWERDLLEAGFSRKLVGYSRYHCPGEKTREILSFLLELGWQVIDFRGRNVVRQTGYHMDFKEENGKIAVRAQIHFQKEEAPLAVLRKTGFWVELNESSVGLLDRKAIELPDGDWENDALYLKKGQAGELGAFLEAPQVQWEHSLRAAAEGLKKGASVENSPPGTSFTGTLLPYQQKGVDWLAFLHRWGFSGLLADEMGLGKTVQVLAFFSRLRTNLPILIVAPTSLLYNWQSEMRKFLNQAVYMHTGPDRLKNLQGIPWIVTSYGTLRQDEELFSLIEFGAIALDESSAIKTASTQTAQAVCRLKGQFKVALCGTPIENRPEELWSQFRFLMPDLLGSRADFKTTEIERLKRKLRPFILRRRKEEVQLDLPEKIEQTVWVEMNETQAEIYESARKGFKAGLLKKVASEGMQAHRMEVLEAILRLRQICCDPRLIGCEESGAKVEQLVADVEEVLASNRKVLIYSQFTTLLQLAKNVFQEKGWNFLYLDGSTPAEVRAEQVRKFQEDPESPLFLLSLKAGGVGLTLTAADTVILFDPWWNVAVESQAIDRAHRIGQKKTVIAKRYLVPGSIEEKMLKLKAQKQTASSQILDFEGEGFTEADLLHLLD